MVLKDGTVAETGAGEELLARDGVYARLYEFGQLRDGRVGRKSLRVVPWIEIP